MWFFVCYIQNLITKKKKTNKKYGFDGFELCMPVIPCFIYILNCFIGIHILLLFEKNPFIGFNLDIWV
jgi:hypothetical protein